MDGDEFDILVANRCRFGPKMIAHGSANFD